MTVLQSIANAVALAIGMPLGAWLYLALLDLRERRAHARRLRETERRARRNRARRMKAVRDARDVSRRILEQSAYSPPGETE